MTDLAGDQERSSGTIQSVMRALDVLEVVAQGGPSSSMTYIAEETGLPGPTVFRLLNTLAVRGYVIKTAQREYSVGPAFLAYNSLSGGGLGRAVDDVLGGLVERVGESAVMAMRDRYSAIFVGHRALGSGGLFAQVGNGVPLHATAVGKSLLSTMPTKSLTRYLKTSNLSRYTERTITEPRLLQAEIERVRDAGYALEDEEHEVGVRSVAVPIPGMVDFAVAVYGSPLRLTDDAIESAVVPLLREMASVVGTDLQEQFPRSPKLFAAPVEAQFLGYGL